MTASGIGISETFLRDSVQTLKSMGQLVAVSGASNPTEEDVRLGVRATGFMDVGFSPFRWARHHVFGDDRWISAVQNRCLKRCIGIVGPRRPCVAWIDYGTTAVFARKLLERLGIPYIVAVHGYDVTSSMRGPVYRREFATTVGLGAAKVVCASEHMARISALAGVPAERTTVLRYAVDAASIRRDNGVPKTANPSFVHLGRLVHQKGPLVTLQAFALTLRQVPNATLTFIGDGDLRPEIESRIGAMGLTGKVRLLGAMGHSQALREMQSHWVYCQHSVIGLDGSQEGFAISPAEAACMELPVVSTLHDGIPEHVLDGETGYLVREFDYVSMAQRMVQLCRNEQLRNSLGKAGRANILALCDPAKRRKGVSELIDLVVMESGA